MYWKIASLLMFIMFCAWVYYESHRTVRLQKKQEEEFWERERQANSVRNKPLNDLNYVVVPDNLPYDLHTDNEEIASYIRTVKGLSDEKIVNFTGYTNTDLKMEYGTGNITKLSMYDQNYTTLVTTLQKWADMLISLDEKNAAIGLLEFCVSIGTDVGKTYYILAEHYLENNDEFAYFDLIDKASDLKSINAENIAKNLRDKVF